MDVYSYLAPTAEEVPVLISVPHCGTLFPAELEPQFDARLIQQPDDTDWFVDELYDFAPGMGMGLVRADYSRWVIDLNRDPQRKPLYNDGRIITDLCPATTFLAEPLYKDQRKSVDPEELLRRVSEYFTPYHDKLRAELKRLHDKFGVVLLWDCHSIRQFVPTIQTEKFPDLILGDADGKSASDLLINTALTSLSGGSYSLNHNHPFKGGYITRHFGQPLKNQHALQLEMSKVNYMEDDELTYSPERAFRIQEVLKNTFVQLICVLKQQSVLR